MPGSLPVLEVLRGAEAYLAARGVESPRLNAEHLLASALGLKRMELYLQFDRPLGEAERAPLRDMVRRRGAREPLQHILGTVEFHGRTFACDARALVPRPETAQLVEIALGLLRGRDAPAVLDAGTGSGVIAITLALELPSATVTATDISGPALELAAANAAKLGAADRVGFVRADLLPPDGGPFDLVAANLPYIPAAEIGGLAPEVRHDPVAALDGGPDGLCLVRRIIASSPSRLAPGGALLLEIGAGQDRAVAELLAGSKFRDISLRQDYQGVPRFALAFHG